MSLTKTKLLQSRVQDILIFTRACQEIALAVPPLEPIPALGQPASSKQNTQHLNFVFAWSLRDPT